MFIVFVDCEVKISWKTVDERCFHEFINSGLAQDLILRVRQVCLWLISYTVYLLLNYCAFIFINQRSNHSLLFFLLSRQHVNGSRNAQNCRNALTYCYKFTWGWEVSDVMIAVKRKANNPQSLFCSHTFVCKRRLFLVYINLLKYTQFILNRRKWWMLL